MRREGPARPALRVVPAAPECRARPESLLRPSVLTRLDALEDLAVLFGPQSPEALVARARLRLRVVPAPPAAPAAPAAE